MARPFINVFCNMGRKECVCLGVGVGGGGYFCSSIDSQPITVFTISSIISTNRLFGGDCQVLEDVLRHRNWTPTKCLHLNHFTALFYSPSGLINHHNCSYCNQHLQVFKTQCSSFQHKAPFFSFLFYFLYRAREM